MAVMDRTRVVNSAIIDIDLGSFFAPPKRFNTFAASLLEAGGSRDFCHAVETLETSPARLIHWS